MEKPLLQARTWVFRTLLPEEAADLIAQACIFKPARIATRLGITGQVMHALVPALGKLP